MAVTGGIKFFEPSLCLFKDGATATANSNSDNASLILNYDKTTTWVSSGSSEGVSATITVTLPAAVAITRMILINHNFENLSITYGAGSTSFSNVVKINNETDTSIFESALDQNTSYFEFDEVTTDQINIQCLNVQNPSTTVEKFLGSLILTNEVGTYSRDGMVDVTSSINANNRVITNINNKAVVQRGIDSFNAGFRAQYLYTQADIDLSAELFDRNEDVLVWLCGGRVGTDYFRFSTKPYRLEDLFRCRSTGAFNHEYYRGLYRTGVKASLSLVEVEG